MKGWHRYFILISVIFLIIALYRGNYLQFPIIYDYKLLLVSIVLLLVAFSSASVTWFLILKRNDCAITFYDALISHFLSIFGKYIPGKFWAVFGRSIYIKDKHRYPLHKISTLSGINQLQITWSGFAFGIIGALLLDLDWHINFLLIAGWLFLTLLLFSRIFYSILQSIINNIFKKNYELPFIGLHSTLFYIPFFILHWSVWFLAFLIFLMALSNEAVTLVSGFAFPLSGTIGNIIAIAPGGFGIREGVMSYFLHESGMSLKQAASLSVAARLWYLVGEVLVFILALLKK